MTDDKNRADNPRERPGLAVYQDASRALTPRGHGLAALLASVVNTLITYPLDVVKTRFQGPH